MPAFDSIPLLLAADFWQVVFGLVVFVLYTIGQLVNARGQTKQEQAQPKRPRRPQAPEEKPLQENRPRRQGFPRQAAEMPAAGQGNQEDTLRREVEDFLRRAQGKPPRQEQPVRPQPLRSEPAQPKTLVQREGVAEHTASHLDTKQMIEHAQRLGNEIGQSDERLESRLHQKFDHQLGSLQHKEKTATSPKKELSVAEEVVALLKKPGGMRQIIVAQEILRRPEW